MKLTKSELSFLSKTYKNTNPLNLFSNSGAELRGGEQKALEDKGILVEGVPSPEAQKVFAAAANPRRCTRLVLKDGTYFIEKYAYKAGGAYTLVENDGGEVIFSPIQQLDEALFQLSQWVGMSDLKTFDLGATLSNNELLVFLALADIRREKELLSYLGNEADNPISFAQIRGQLESPRPGSLTRILTGNYQYHVPYAEGTETILNQLISKKIVAFQAGYSLIGKYEEFAKNFLILQTIVMLETFNLTDNNEIAGAGVLCVWAGMKEIISIVFREEAAEISSVSGRQLLKMIEDFLNCPDVVGSTYGGK